MADWKVAVPMRSTDDDDTAVLRGAFTDQVTGATITVTTTVTQAGVVETKVDDSQQRLTLLGMWRVSS